MRLSNFIQLLQNYRKFNDDISNLHSMGFDLMEGQFQLTYPINNIFKTSLLAHYTQEGYEWVEWFVFENEYGLKDWSTAPGYRMKEDGTSEQVYEKGERRYGAHDENGNPICYSIESLWEYLEQNHKIEE